MALVRSENRILTTLAWLNVVIHAAALVLAVVGVRPGSRLVALEARVTYVAAAPPAWSLGWGAFMLCALALVAFFTALAHRLPDKAPIPQLAVLVAVAAGALDLFCDVVYITVLPRVAAGVDPSHTLFLAIEHLASSGGLVVANGLYSVGVLLLTLCVRRHPARVPGMVATGYGTFGFGMVLVAAGFLDAPWLAELATGPTLGAYCVWTVLVARSLERAGDQA
jgi:hypothetical protein